MSTRRFTTGLGVAAAVLLCAVLSSADGLIIIDDPKMPPIRPDMPHRFAPLAVKYHHVSVRITDQVAVTEIDQVFFNPSDRRLEGTYLFPLPRGAQIDRFSMDVNGKMTEAELLDAGKARRIYEDIVRRMRDPALLEYAGKGLLKARIFPIEPHSEKRVMLRYTQLLRSDGGMVEYLYPLNTEKFSSRPLESVSVKVELESKQGIRTLYSPSHEVDISRHGRTRAVVGWEANNTLPDTDFQLFFAPERSVDDVGLDLLTYHDGEDRGYFMLLATPSSQMADEKIVAKDVVFVLDTSGSMSHLHKLDQARRALQFCLANLNAGDRFELIRFSTESEPLFGKLAAADRANVTLAEEWVASLRPVGGTAIEEALLDALTTSGGEAGGQRPFVVVFLTDGRPTIGNTDTDAILAKVGGALSERPTRIFCFGIGTDVNTHLLDRITEKTRSASQYVLPEEDIEVKVSRFFTKINAPVLAAPELSFGRGIRVSAMHPGTLPDLFKGEQLVVLGRYSGSGDVAITLDGTVNGHDRKFVYEGTFARHADELDFIPRLWATRRVGFLLDQIRLHGDSEELRDEVTRLARRYGIVTPYTAYLIVEDEADRGVPITSRSLQGLDQDRELRQESGRMFEEVNVATSGDAAVGGAQAYDALKRSTVASAPAAANVHARRGQADGPALAGKVVEAVQNQQQRYVGGRAFYFNGGQWIDSEVAGRPEARRVRITFNSDEYFSLMKRHPAAAQWLSLGSTVQLLIDDVIYEIVDTTAK